MTTKIFLNGDTLDTDAIYKDTLKKIFNLDNYKLSEVKIVPPTANLKLVSSLPKTAPSTILKY